LPGITVVEKIARTLILTKCKAVLVGDGRAFEEIAAERALPAPAAAAQPPEPSQAPEPPAAI